MLLLMSNIVVELLKSYIVLKFPKSKIVIKFSKSDNVADIRYLGRYEALFIEASSRTASSSIFHFIFRVVLMQRRLTLPSIV